MEWISVEDKIPPKDKVFLGYIKKGEIQTCYWCIFEENFKEACNCSGYERETKSIEITH